VSDPSAWRQMFVDYLAEWPSLCQSILPPPLLHRSIAKYEALLAMLPPPDGPCIIHMDYRPGNILLAHGRITGLIDFESARGGSAERDFCKIKEELWDIDPHTRQPFLDGYQAVRPLPDLALALPLCELQNVMASLVWCLRRNALSGPFFEGNLRSLERITAE
jgi:Ser/Thr protein kinase RdoA (MazF antagonist)